MGQGKSWIPFFNTDLPSLWKRSRVALLNAMRKGSKVAESDPNLARKLTMDNNHKNVTYLGTVDSSEIAYTPCFAVLDWHEIPLVPHSAVLTCGLHDTRKPALFRLTRPTSRGGGKQAVTRQR